MVSSINNSKLNIKNLSLIMPDGTMRKVTDVVKLNSLGWKETIDLAEGIKKLYKWYVKR